MKQKSGIKNVLRNSIPGRIIIGVTGHRKIACGPILAKKIREVIATIKIDLPELKNTPIVFSILSPLAEGADRFVVRKILKTPNSQLEAILPLGKSEYIKDFTNVKSKAEFEMLLSQARRIRQIPQSQNRTEAYERVGRYIVDQCDILIALWDGKPAGGKGGTGEVIQYARENQVPFFWINTQKNGAIIYEKGRGLGIGALQDLDRYNSENQNWQNIIEKTRNQFSRLNHIAQQVGFHSPKLEQIKDHLWAHFAKADSLAVQYRRLYFLAGTSVYILAALAVCIAAFQAIFIDPLLMIGLLEALIIASIMVIVWLGNNKRWHKRWIDYRFLAERFRAAVFLYASNVDIITLRPQRNLKNIYSSQDWIISAFSYVWDCFASYQSKPTRFFQTLKQFIISGWVQEQSRYQNWIAKKNKKHYFILTNLSLALYFITFAAIIMHTAHLGSEWLQKSSLFLAIVCPAFGGAISAIRTHREYRRNFSRAEDMHYHLKDLENQIQNVHNIPNLLPLLRTMDETMLHENEDWRVVVRFHELEPTA